MNTLKIKRIYETPDKDDGIRIFVDRLWARGITKEKAHLDYWYKEIAPSSELRKWFNHKAQKYSEFKKLYKKELDCNFNQIQNIKKILQKNNVTLIYAAKNPNINHAIVLKEFIEECSSKKTE